MAAFEVVCNWRPETSWLITDICVDVWGVRERERERVALMEAHTTIPLPSSKQLSPESENLVRKKDSQRTRCVDAQRRGDCEKPGKPTNLQ